MQCIVQKAIRTIFGESLNEIDILNDPQWRDLFLGSDRDPKMIAKFKRFLRDNRYARIVMYHGTSAKNEILPVQGLLPTSGKRRRSLQSGSGYVYLSLYPDAAETFARFAYPSEDEHVVYRVSVPISMLSPDKDQLRNKAMWSQYDGPRDLAASLIVGHGAAVRGSIPVSMITVHKKTSKKVVKEATATATRSIPSFEKVWEILGNDGDSMNHEYEGRLDDRNTIREFEQENDCEYDDEKEEDREKLMAWLKEDMKFEFEIKYDDELRGLRGMDGELCWRMMTLPRDTDPRKLESIGIYWATSEWAADAHWGNDGKKVLYEAKINLDHVDWLGTLVARLTPGIGEDEQEIRFYNDRPIYVTRVAAILGGRQKRWLAIDAMKQT